MKKITILLVVCSIFSISKAQTLDAYRIFTGKGELTDFGAMANQVSKNQVILFEELHDNPIAH